jgi:hypothetical protein
MNGVTQFSNLVQLEDFIRDNLELVDLPVSHYQLPGVYVRALHIKGGVVLTGKIHKHSCINIMAKGLLKVASEDGTAKEMKAGDIFVSPPGTKRAGYAMQDSIFITVHPTNETELDAIEESLVCGTVEDYVNYLEVSKCLLQV